MRPCFHIEITTPKKFVLNGLWLGPKKAKKVFVWVHGLGSSMFSKMNIADLLVNSQTAVVMFNNRGHDKVTSIKRTDGSYVRAGAVHEVFTDCVDDIQGAINFANTQGAKDVYLVGHSTGCQKTMYWASKRRRGVRGIIILAPISDYAAELMAQGKSAIKKAALVADAYIKKGKKNAVLPEDVWRWPWIADAQRFLSLYSGNSAEEIFTYWDVSMHPRTLTSVRVPILVMLAEKEEFSDIPAKEIASWFEEHLYRGEVIIVPRVGHGFKGGERSVSAHIHRFIGS